jgi:hypothetical protein
VSAKFIGAVAMVSAYRSFAFVFSLFLWHVVVEFVLCSCSSPFVVGLACGFSVVFARDSSI